MVIFYILNSGLVYDLGTFGGQIWNTGIETIDVTSIPNYKKLTADNFVVQVTQREVHWTATDWVGDTHGYVPTVSYDAENGLVKIQYCFKVTKNDYTGYVGYKCKAFCYIKSKTI